MIAEPRRFLLDLYAAAVAAAGAEKCLPPFLPQLPSKGRTIIIGAGKAAAAMAQAVEQHWPHSLEGLVVTRYGHGADCRHIEVMQAAHPVPDDAGQHAARRMLEKVHGLTGDDLVLCLISGGGSALLTLPADGITLAHKQTLNKALLNSGATIAEINCVRKHLSAIKGGRLALACSPARIVTLMISDVPGDDPAVIASGPTLPDSSTCGDALSILRKYRIAIPDAVRRHLESNAGETPKPGDARFSRNAHHVIARSRDSLEAAAVAAREAGVIPYILSDAIEGEARTIGAMHAAIAMESALRNRPFAKPCVLLSGGETTVTVRGNGRGGRNTEFLLGLALTLDGCPGVHAIACVPMALMAPKTMPARYAALIRWRVPHRWACSRKPCWMTMTHTDFSMRLATWWSAGRAGPTSMTSGQS